MEHKIKVLQFKNPTNLMLNLAHNTPQVVTRNGFPVRLYKSILLRSFCNKDYHHSLFNSLQLEYWTNRLRHVELNNDICLLQQAKKATTIQIKKNAGEKPLKRSEMKQLIKRSETGYNNRIRDLKKTRYEVRRALITITFKKFFQKDIFYRISTFIQTLLASKFILGVKKFFIIIISGVKKFFIIIKKMWRR